MYSHRELDDVKMFERSSARDSQPEQVTTATIFRGRFLFISWRRDQIRHALQTNLSNKTIRKIAMHDLVIYTSSTNIFEVYVLNILFAAADCLADHAACFSTSVSRD
ncbi:unnamed protein product [Ixodes pacificus]